MSKDHIMHQPPRGQNPQTHAKNKLWNISSEHVCRTLTLCFFFGGGRRILRRGELLLLISALRLPVVHLTLAGVARSSVPNPEIPNPKTLTKRRTYCNGSSHSYGQPRSASPDRHMRTKVIKYSSHRPGIRACVSSSLGN